MTYLLRAFIIYQNIHHHSTIWTLQKKKHAALARWTTHITYTLSAWTMDNLTFWLHTIRVTCQSPPIVLTEKSVSFVLYRTHVWQRARSAHTQKQKKKTKIKPKPRSLIIKYTVTKTAHYIIAEDRFCVLRRFTSRQFGFYLYHSIEILMLLLNKLLKSIRLESPQCTW